MIISGVLLTVGDIAMKKWVVSKSSPIYVYGLVAYFIGLNFLAQSYLFKHVAVATLIVNILNIVTLTIISWVVFKDYLTIKQGIGMILALVSIILMN